jgi:hypothetical protein
LIEPPYDTRRWDNVLHEYGITGKYQTAPFDRTAYIAHLLAEPRRSPTSSYARLIDDIRNDITRLPQFYETATRVADIDGERRQSLAYASALMCNERVNAVRRTRENDCVVAWVRDTPNDRIASYRFALERLVIITPSPQAADAERTLNQLTYALPPRLAAGPTHVAESY